VLSVENCSALGLEEFDGNHRFALYQLKNSLMNVSSEPKVKKILDTELLKKITGEDLIEAEAKGVQTRVKFSNTAKEIVLGNEYPRVEDTTNAFWDRVRLLNFPCRFVGKDQPQSIEKTWLSTPRERSGILNWMLEGLQRLLRNREFTMSRSQENQIIDFKRASDSIGAFVAEMVVFDPKLFTSRPESYSCYKDYCDNIGVSSENDKAFYNRMRKTPKIKEAKKNKTRGFLGFAIKRKNGQQLLPEDDIEDLDAEEKPKNSTTDEKANQETLNFGTAGTAGTGSTPAVPYPVNNTPTQEIGETPVPSVPSVPAPVACEEPAIGKRECGLCSNSHKGTCSFPSGPECTGSHCDYAENCRDYKPKDGKGGEGC
jgi:phage/plasmid-associated DNA primase